MANFVNESYDENEEVTNLFEEQPEEPQEEQAPEAEVADVATSSR